MYSLDGKVVFITGGAQGLGKGYAEALLEKKCKIAFCDLNERTGRETEQQFAQKFGKENVAFYVVDVTKTEVFEEAFKKAVSNFGRVDIFLNNAGVLNEGIWRKMIEINFIGTVLGTHMALEHMRKDKGGAGGRIVNVSSLFGLVDGYTQPVYNGTKHAVRSFTSSIAIEPDFVANKGVEVAVLCPNLADTDLVNKLDSTKIHDFGKIKPTIPAIKMPVSVPVAAMLQLLQLDEMNGAILFVESKGTNFEKMERKNVGTTWPDPKTSE